MAKSTVLQATNHQQPSHGMLTATGESPAILGLCILAYSLPLHLSILPSRGLPHSYLTCTSLSLYLSLGSPGSSGDRLAV